MCTIAHHSMTLKPIRLIDLFRYYRALPHQNAALHELEQAVLNAAPDTFNRDQNWYTTWSAAVNDKQYGPAIQIIKEFEGCHLNAYRCPANVMTIGWGTTQYPGGARVKLGDSISKQRADELLVLEIDRIAGVLSDSIPYWQEMNINQRSALISFAYNLGAYFMHNSGFATISRTLMAKHWDGVPEAMLLYRNPGSHFEAGLKRRRIAEGNLWIKPV
jgi:lysozyme